MKAYISYELNGETYPELNTQSFECNTMRSKATFTRLVRKAREDGLIAKYFGKGKVVYAKATMNGNEVMGMLTWTD
jgi:hypothetical protein